MASRLAPVSAVAPQKQADERQKIAKGMLTFRRCSLKLATTATSCTRSAERDEPTRR